MNKTADVGLNIVYLNPLHTEASFSCPTKQQTLLVSVKVSRTTDYTHQTSSVQGVNSHATCHRIELQVFYVLTLLPSVSGFFYWWYNIIYFQDLLIMCIFSKHNTKLVLRLINYGDSLLAEAIS
jgi:hypothetical protein